MKDTKTYFIIKIGWKQVHTISARLIPLSFPIINQTTSFLTATILTLFLWAGITAGAGTRLVLKLFLIKGFKLYSFQLLNRLLHSALVLVVTFSEKTSVSIRKIFTPAAFLGSGRHLSGALSGTEPKFPVTRGILVSPIH